MIGDRIKQARHAAGLSLRALGEQAGVSAMAISKYERSESVPSSKVLLALARVLNVRVEYFFRQVELELREPDFRKRSNLPKKVQHQIEGDVIEQLERFVELEKFLPGRLVQRFELPEGLPPRIESYEDVESVAIKVRQAWKLGLNPVSELTDTLEERGIKVFQSAALHGDRFDGLAAQVDGMAVIVVGHDWPGDRQRFTLSHELGHLVLKGRLAAGLDEEKAANRFAGAFLVPDSSVLTELGRKRTWLEPKELCVLKSIYGLSMGGWLHRALDLGILPRVHYESMVRFFRQHGWHKKEPCEEYPRERPKLFTQLVFHALAEELIGESKAAELMRLPIREFRSLRNMESAPGSADH